MPVPNEQTPLIVSVRIGRDGPGYQRFPHSTFRRFCTIALGCTLILVIIGFLIPFAILPSDRHCHGPSCRRGPHHHDGTFSASTYSAIWPQSERLTLDDLKEIILETPSEERARDSSAYYAAGPHLAGKNLSQALWTRDRWQEAGVKSDIISYDVYINYPVGHRLALLRKKKHGYKVEVEASLEEDEIEEDPTTSLKDRIPTFHGYSANGNVTAPYVFVNFGTFQDFEDLRQRNVSLEGKIALAKYGRNFRGLKVKRAQELGMVGVVIYTDPQEDGEMTELNGHKPYPAGPARNPSSVQRGSTQFLSKYSPLVVDPADHCSGILPGDPTTPGYPSKPGVPRTNGNLSIPTIPSLPISYRDAIPLLQALNGHGPKASSFNEWWQGGGLAYKNVSYNIGPTPDDLVLNLHNEQEYITNPIWNVIGIINGTLPDEVIILGNHRDAWIAGGAGDPNSGSAALIEVIRSFGVALSRGWKPLRTIVFASWDGEEYGLVGSTEWVEEYIPWLSATTIAYLNVDVGARGSHFSASASPLLNDLIYNVTSLIQSPNQTTPGQTVLDTWTSRNIRTMGSGSDFTAFQDFAGIASLDIGFGAGPNDPIYHYHSNYDSFYWMDHYGDKTWQYHTTIAKIWALLAATISETPILPLSAATYAQGLEKYMASVKHSAKSSNISHSSFDFTRLEGAAENFTLTAKTFDNYTSTLATSLGENIPWWKFWRKLKLQLAVKAANTKLKLLEREFLHADGLDGDRSWFKHVVFAPGRWTGYSGATFPGLVEAFEDGDLNGVKKWEGIVLGKLRGARRLLG